MVNPLCSSILAVIGAATDDSEQQVFGAGVLVAEVLPFLRCQHNYLFCCLAQSQTGRYSKFTWSLRNLVAHPVNRQSARRRERLVRTK